MAKRNYGATPGMRVPSKRSMAPARLCQVFNAALSSSPDSGICKLKTRARWTQTCPTVGPIFYGQYNL